MAVIDFHTHVFPDTLAPRALAELTAKAGGLPAHTDGTAAGLRASMARAGLATSVVLLVSTRPEQTPAINRFCLQLRGAGLAPFGTLHPRYADNAAELARLAAAGVRGVKFHPEYQGFEADDPALFPLYRAIAAAGLLALFHAGGDIAYPPPYHGRPEQLARVLDAVPELTLIAAHFGGFQMWDEVERHLLGRRVYLETSFTHGYLPPARFVALARRHGIERVLFGTDSPWNDQAEALAALRASGLTGPELQAVLHDNAARLLRSRNSGKERA